MERVDFWRLSRAVQERFVESSKGACTPSPLCVSRQAKGTPVFGWIALGSLSLIAEGVALRLGYGDLKSRYALAPAWFCALDAALLALSAFALASAAAARATSDAVPYRPALYLFPIGVIDARAPKFLVYRVSEQTRVTIDEASHSLRIAFADVAFDFPTSSPGQAEHAARALDAAREQIGLAVEETNIRAQSLVDPLIDNGFKNPFAPTESLREKRTFWVKAWLSLALILGVLLGGASYRFRNTLSEARLYAAARAADRADVYRQYLARGGQNRSVETLLLPRAELRDAVAKGSVLAIEQFSASHPHTEIEPEVDAALHRALSQDLRAAEAVGTLTALKDFAERYARYPFLTADIERALDARISAALSGLKPLLALNQSRLLPFFERLLRFTEKRGPELVVRFQSKPIETLDSAEKALRRNAYYSGEKSLPRLYFDRAHAAPREAAAAGALAAALAQHLPADLVRPRIAATEEAPSDAKGAPNETRSPEPSVPTLLISYHTELNGLFSNRSPRFAVAGIGILCRASFEVPGYSDSLIFKLSVWRAPNLKAVSATSGPGDLYETMATEAFKRFTQKYLATLFAADR